MDAQKKLDYSVRYMYNDTNQTVTGRYVLEQSATNGTVTPYLRGANLISDGTNYYLYNAHGDVVQLTNAIGTVTKSYSYDAFGNQLNTIANDTNPFRYCGEYYDTETGLYYLRARYYDPTVGMLETELFFMITEPTELNS